MAEGVRMEVDFDDGGLGRALQRAAQRGDDMRPMLEGSADIVEASTDRRFATGQGPDGIPWLVSRRAAQQGGKTLVDRGLLRGSMAREITETSMQFGVDGQNTSAKYARVHQFGATIRAKNKPKLVFRGVDGFVAVDQVTIPARPFLGIDAQDLSDLEDEWTEGVKEAFDGSS